jgi:glycosyltransferase involved in cell wall biosynthesis
MKTPGNIVMFSTSYWDSPHWFRRQHFALHLARNGWRVVYVEPLHTITTVLRNRICDDSRDYGMRPCANPSPQTENLTVYRPPAALPFIVRNACMATLARRLLQQRIHRDFRAILETDRYLQVVYNPSDQYLLTTGNPVVYEIIDRFSAYPEYAGRGRWMERISRRLAARAVLVSATTEELAAQVSATRHVVIPNGVDLKHFVDSRQDPEPDDLAAIPHPRAVYVGAIYPWFDLDLLIDMARRFPPVQFVLIGFLESALPHLPHNVRYLGPKPRHELPAYLQQCELGLIPFKIDDLTRHVDPLKFYEYMAADLPTVSTFMYTLEKYRGPGVLSLADDAETFAAGVRDMLRTARQGRNARRAIAERHAWRKLSGDFETELLRLAPGDG